MTATYSPQQVFRSEPDPQLFATQLLVPPPSELSVLAAIADEARLVFNRLHRPDERRQVGDEILRHAAAASSLKFVRFQWSLARTSNSEHTHFVANNHEHTAIASAAASLKLELTKLISDELGFRREAVAVWVINQFVDSLVEREPPSNRSVG